MRILKKYKSFTESRLNNLRKMSDDGKSDEEKILDYLKVEYPSDWFDSQLSDRVHDYVDEDDAEDYDGDYEEAYRNLCTGGAIEYDLLSDMEKDLSVKFPNVKNDDILDIINDYLIDTCSWHDSLVFNRSTDEYKSSFDKMFGLNPLKTSDWGNEKEIKGDLDGFKS